MIFLDVTLDHPLLRDAVRAVPGLKVHWIRDSQDNGNRGMLFRVDGGDFKLVDSAIDADPTVTDCQSVDIGGQRLYHVRLANKAVETDLYPVLVALDGIVVSATCSSDGWHCQIGFPSQDDLHRFLEAVENFGIEFDIRRRYRLADIGEHADFGLTEGQREALLSALEAGHFQVPRESTQVDISKTLGISDVALSQRLRRGMKTLIENTLQSDSPALGD